MSAGGVSGPVAAALSGTPDLGAKYEAFRDAAHEALGAQLVAHVRHAVAEVHGVASTAPHGEAPAATIAYARRMPFEHTAITDEEAAAVVAEIGEVRFVALSVVAALADAECRAGMVDLEALVDGA